MKPPRRLRLLAPHGIRARKPAAAGTVLLTAALLLLPAAPAFAQIRAGRVVGMGGTIVPSGADGGPGMMTFDADWLATGGNLEIRVTDRPGGCAHSALRVTRTARLGGNVRLTLVFLDGYEPRLGDTYDVLVVGDLAGGFDHVESPGLPPGLALQVESLPDRVRLAVIPVIPAEIADPAVP